MADRSTGPLERRLAELRPARGDAAPRIPGLDGRRRLVPRAADVLAARGPEADPWTGHRGAGEGHAIVLRAGEAIVGLTVTRDGRGLVVRGQVARLPDPAGTLVHLRTTAGVVLACATPAGEITARLPEAPLVAVDVETDEGAWSARWVDGGA